MSATVEPVDMFMASCMACCLSCLYLSEAAANEWAAAHDAENHETDTSDDDAYERFKEARHDD